MNRKIMLSDLESIKKFASSYVGSIIEEAIKQSLSRSSSWLIHCSENCHQINIVQRSRCNSFLFWTPEEEEEGINEEDRAECSGNGKLSSSRSNSNNNTTAATNTEEMCSVGEEYALKCQQPVVDDEEGKEVDATAELYSLPADTITIFDNKETKNGSNRCYKMSASHNCLKPKAYHALSLLKSHHKTLNDLKLFLINLYSSNDDMAVKTIGSDRSAFTRYYKRINASTSSPSAADTSRIFSSNNVCGGENEEDDNDENEDQNYDEDEDYVLVEGGNKNESGNAPAAAAANTASSFTVATATATASTVFYQKREENRNILRLNSENSSVRKCNKIKRRNFFNIKRSFRKVFKSSSSSPPPPHDAKERLQSSFEQEPATRSLPPLPPSHQGSSRPKRTFSFGKSGKTLAAAGSNETSVLIDVGIGHTYLDVSAAAAAEKEVATANTVPYDEKESRDCVEAAAVAAEDQCVISGDKLFDFVSNIEKVKDVSFLEN